MENQTPDRRLLNALIHFVVSLFSRVTHALTGNEPCCRFTPSCSHYVSRAYRTHGFFKATFLAAKRIVRCHPWGTSGFDPVPAP